MKIRKNTIISAIVLTVAMMSAGCSKPADEKAAGGAPAAGKPAQEIQIPEVQTAVAVREPIQLVKQYIGEIKPFYSVELRSTASGWLTNITVDTGDRVEKNALIATIEHEEVKAQAAQAEANISVAKASVARAEAELENVLLETRRSESLFEKGYIAKREYEQAQTAEKQARASLDAAKGQLDQAKAQLKNIQVQLRDTSVRAPFAGIVAERYLDPGAYVSPSNTILKLVDDSTVKAVVNVVEEDLPFLREGAISDLVLDSFPGRTFQGKIVRVAPALDQSSRTAMVEVHITNTEGILRSGMTARVNLVVSQNPEAVVVPEAAVRKDVEAGTDYVFIFSEEKAVRRDVVVGIIAKGRIETAEGLEPGEEVIVTNIRLSDGMQVKLAGQEGDAK